MRVHEAYLLSYLVSGVSNGRSVGCGERICEPAQMMRSLLLAGVMDRKEKRRRKGNKLYIHRRPFL